MWIYLLYEYDKKKKNCQCLLMAVDKDIEMYVGDVSDI